ncbi:MAG: murein biosynthesis integral membrane protein MurJ [Chloroflexi bacterium]|nr:murein biosynthesis integral membrane protein MurJ [Chloroflexota bacterium]
MQTPTQDASKQVARAAGTVMLAMVISQLASLAQSVLIARSFGTSPELDAFYAANRVSETLFVLVAAGALSSAFIPAFTAFLAKDDRPAAWRLASAVANLLLLTLSLLAGLAALFAPQIVRYTLAPGLAQDPGLFELTVELLRLQLVSVVLFGLGGLLVAILNSHQVFFVPALTPAMYRFGLIFGVLALAPRLGIRGLAWGVVIGAGLYLLLQVPAVWKLRPRYTLTLGWKERAVAEALRLMGPRLFGVAVVQLNFWVNTWLASQMGQGSLSAVQYGYAFMLMAQAAIAQSVAIAAMPTFSTQFALGRFDDLRETLASSLRGVTLLAFPACAGLALLRGPIIVLFYQRGEFTAESTRMVAWALLWYAAGLVGHSILEVLARAFYALHDTRTPALVGAAAMGLNVAFSFSFSSLFEQSGWMPHGGLALANSLATALEAAALFLLMRRRLRGIQGRRVALGLGQAALATLCMALALYGWRQAMAASPAWLLALGGVFTGGTVYGLAAWLLRVPELRAMAGALRQRVGR